MTRWFGQGGEQLGEADDANRTTALFVGRSESTMREMGMAAGANKGAPGPGNDNPTGGSGDSSGGNSSSGDSSGAAGNIGKSGKKT